MVQSPARATPASSSIAITLDLISSGRLNKTVGTLRGFVGRLSPIRQDFFHAGVQCWCHEANTLDACCRNPVDRSEPDKRGMPPAADPSNRGLRTNASNRWAITLGHVQTTRRT